MRASLVLTSLFLLFGLSTPAMAGRELHDTDLSIDSTWQLGQQTTVLVRATIAASHDQRRPASGAEIRAWLESEDPNKPSKHALAHTTADKNGQAALRFDVPAVALGRYRLHVETASRAGRSEAQAVVEVTEDIQLVLRTDRGVYKPGQTLYWRLTALHKGNAHSLADRELRITIEDPRGTDLWSAVSRTDDHGTIGGDLPLSEDLSPGKYSIRAESVTSSEVSTRESFELKAFRLPPFELEIQVPKGQSKRPGQKLTVDVIGRYHFGEPVAGKLAVYAGSEAIAEGLTLDRHGRRRLQVTIPKHEQVLELQAALVDGAGQKSSAKHEVAIETAGRLSLAVIPEQFNLPGDAPTFITIVTSNGQGGLKPARIRLESDSLDDAIVVNSPGAVRVPLTLRGEHSSYYRIEVSASTKDGLVETTNLEGSLVQDDQLLRVDDRLISPGEPIVVGGGWPTNGAATVVTLLRHGSPITSSLATVDGKGRLAATLSAPRGVFGLATVRVSDLHWDPTTGRVLWRSSQRNVFLQPHELAVAVDGELRLSPGKSHTLSVSVRDVDGKPLDNVGVAASIVDERILALSEPRPDITEVLRSMDLERASAAGLLFADLTRDGVDDIETLVAQAILDMLPTHDAAAQVHIAAAVRLRSELERLEKAYPLVREQLVQTVGAIASDADPAKMRSTLDDELRRASFDENQRKTPWGDPTSWVYAARVLPAFTEQALIDEVQDLRLDQLREHLLAHEGRFKAALKKTGAGALGSLGKLGYLAIDVWGTPLRIDRVGDVAAINLRSAGPDRTFETPDDRLRYDVFHEASGHGYGYGSGRGSLGGRVVRAPSVRMGAASVTNGEAPLRHRFDETALWAFGVVTDHRGLARLPVTMPDSITGWRVEVQAVDGKGGIGAARARLETFAESFASANVPDELTLGDRLSAPVVVHNHGERSARFSLSFKTSEHLAVLDSERTLTLEPGRTGVLSLPLHALAPGQGSVRTTLSRDGKVVDRSLQRIQVRARGSLHHHRIARDLSAVGSTPELSFTVPKGTAQSSASLLLLRGVTDQALEGIESLLQTPHGCFEQTSSTTYPNLLVLSLLEERPATSAVRKRARDLVAKGYQRLISYEVPGGGFSWFGETPANQVLTAFGLMEFVDMQKVFPVDPDLIERTRKWLASKQNPDGSFDPDKSWLHDWSAVQGKVSITAYIAWALAEAGERGRSVQRALSYLRRHESELRKSPYLTALWVNAELLVGRRPQMAEQLARTLERDDDGRFASARGATLFYATGQQADAQVSALVAMALERAGEPARAKEVLRWLGNKRAPQGGWGTTQTTVLALRAHVLTTREAPLEGQVRVLQGQRLLGTLELGSPELFHIPLPDLREGAHHLRFEGADLAKAGLTAELRLQTRGTQPDQSESHGLTVALRAPKKQLYVGDPVDLAVVVGNPGAETVAMPTIRIPVPPGFLVDTEHLRREQGLRRISRFEDHGSELVLYLDRLPGSTTATVPYRLIAETECRVSQHGAHVYAYYSPETWGRSAASIVEVRAHRGSVAQPRHPQPMR